MPSIEGVGHLKIAVLLRHDRIIGVTKTRPSGDALITQIRYDLHTHHTSYANGGLFEHFKADSLRCRSGGSVHHQRKGARLICVMFGYCKSHEIIAISSVSTH